MLELLAKLYPSNGNVDAHDKNLNSENRCVITPWYSKSQFFKKRDFRLLS